MARSTIDNRQLLEDFIKKNVMGMVVEGYNKIQFRGLQLFIKNHMDEFGHVWGTERDGKFFLINQSLVKKHG